MIEQIGKNMYGKEEGGVVSAIDKESACLLGMRGMRYQFQPLEDLKAETDFELRTWKVTWWMNQRSIMKVLAHHVSTRGPQGGDRLRAAHVEGHVVDEPALHHEGPRPPRLHSRTSRRRPTSSCARGRSRGG